MKDNTKTALHDLRGNFWTTKFDLKTEIVKSHPGNTGKHAIYALAHVLVTKCYSKVELVNMVNHLLTLLPEDKYKEIANSDFVGFIVTDFLIKEK